MWGDEFAMNMQTQDGYMVVQSTDGWYYYATLNSLGDYAPTTYRAGVDSPPAGAYQLQRTHPCTDTINAHIAQFSAQVTANAQWFAQKRAAANGQPVTLRIAVIFVQFANVPHYNPNIPPRIGGYLQSDFNNMLFSQNFWIGPQNNNKHPEGDQIFGSMWDYYSQMSLGKLLLTGTFINPVDANGIPVWLGLSSNKIAYDGRTPYLAQEAYSKLLDSNRINPSHWPSPAGYDKWIYIFAQNDPNQFTHGDAQAGAYIQVPERSGPHLTGSQNVTFTHIGTISHEFGHDLGFKDEYGSSGNDSIYNDCSCSNTGKYDLMAYGLYNGPQSKGECPASIDPYYRVSSGWVQPITIGRDTVSVVSKYNYNTPTYYRIEPFDRNVSLDEHYIIETRRRTGFDAYVPTPPNQFANQPGILLVWHHRGPIIDNLGTVPNLFDRIRLVAADNINPGSFSPTVGGFFPKDAVSNLQSLNDISVPNAALTFDATIGTHQVGYPAHFALTNIHRHNSSNPDSDYTVIDTISLKLTLAAGTVTRNSTWKYTVRVVDNLTIQAGTTLTVTPGTQIYVNPGKTITVNGSLIANGTSASRITFTSINPSPGPGDWAGIVCSGGGPNTLTYCNISYATKGITVATNPTTLQDDSITNCKSYGIFSYAQGYGALNVYGVTLSNDSIGMFLSGWAQSGLSPTSGAGTHLVNSSSAGLYASNGSYMYLNRSSMMNNGGYGLSIHGSNTNIYTSGNDGNSPGYDTIANNTGGQIYVDSSAHAYLGLVQTGCDCGSQSTIPIIKPGETMSGCGPGCTLVTHYYQGYNRIYGNAIWVYNQTGAVINAELNYWGLPLTCYPTTTYFVPPSLVAINPTLCGGGSASPGTVPIALLGADGGGPQSRGSLDLKIRSLSDAPPPSQSDSLRDLSMIHALSYGIKNEPDSSLSLLSMLEAFVGPGGKYPQALHDGESWQNYLSETADSTSSPDMKKLVLEKKVQGWINAQDYTSAVAFTDSLLAQYPNDNNVWYFCQEERVLANISLGQVPTAEGLFNTHIIKETQVSPDAAYDVGLVLDAVSGTSNFSKAVTTYRKNRDGELSTVNREKTYRLFQSYPNPFNPSTKIDYVIPEVVMVHLRVFNVLGQVVRTLVDEQQQAG